MSVFKYFDIYFLISIRDFLSISQINYLKKISISKIVCKSISVNKKYMKSITHFYLSRCQTHTRVRITTYGERCRRIFTGIDSLEPIPLQNITQAFIKIFKLFYIYFLHSIRNHYLIVISIIVFQLFFQNILRIYMFRVKEFYLFMSLI